MSWHVEAALLRRYADGELDRARASSLEVHLLACAECRALTSAAVEPARLDRIWHEVRDGIDRPRPRLVERVLRALGAPDHLARLVAATPALQASWFTAVAFALGWAVLAARGSQRGVLLFLVVAPMIPLAGIAVSFGPAIDPTYEIGVSSPMRGFRLLLIRAGTVLAATTTLVGAASFAVPGVGWKAAAWLLPALGLALSALALSTWIDPLKAAATIGVAWIAVTTIGAASTRGLPVLHRLVAFEPEGQVAFAFLIAAALALIAARASRFDLGREA